jgi:hypothetical protein
MPTIGNRPHNLIQGLSDFWNRFFADYEELHSLYQGVELGLAQAYLDMLSSFLNISIVETPLFNTEFFKLVLAREDRITFEEGVNPAYDRYVLPMPTSIVKADILQNKVIETTADLETGIDYEQDTTNYNFRFKIDPSGTSEKLLSETTEGSLLTYGTGSLARFYTVNDTPFTEARVGQWLVISNSLSGNNGAYYVGGVVDGQAILLQGTITLPEINNGNLRGQLLETGFLPVAGFANRSVQVAVGGSFDDSTLRALYDGASWYSTAHGVGVRKGDILRILDYAAVPVVPTDFEIAVVRHDKLYVNSLSVIPKDATGVDYVILRRPSNAVVKEEFVVFVKTGVPKPVAPATNGSISVVAGETHFTIPGISPSLFASTDKQRYITLSSSGVISWTASLDTGGGLVRTAGITNPTVRAAVNGTVTISGSTLGQDGVYVITDIPDTLSLVLSGTFLPETGLTVFLDGVTNSVTAQIRRVVSTTDVVLSLALCSPDANNGAVGWQIHDGFRVYLGHTRVIRNTLVPHMMGGNTYEGGYREMKEGVEFIVNYETGELTQIGSLAGRWAMTVPEKANVDYEWMRELVSIRTTGVLSTTPTDLAVTEAAFWAPDIRVDKYHLYNNYGYLINRFEPSSETYREFIRGVFQLYILGPVLERIESALNVVAGFPVARDDGETLISFTPAVGDEPIILKTLRLNGTVGTYEFPKGTMLRPDIVAYIPDVSATITFESFEPLTIMFMVTDYVQDPTWWDSIVIPVDLMPEESTERRTTLPILYEHVIGAEDDPRIGDPGLFIGADDEGNVPPFISLFPAKRRKMANVVMNTWLKTHMFYVSFDAAVHAILSASFVNDLRELILVAKPSDKYVYIEPSSNFIDVVQINERFAIDGTVGLTETMLYSSTLVISDEWNIGDVFHSLPPTVNAPLLISTGVGIPAPVALPAHLVAVHVSIPAGAAGFMGGFKDYTVNYITGVLTPLTVWPAGVYTVDYSRRSMMPQVAKNLTFGDTDHLIGGLDPERTHVHRLRFANGTILSASGSKFFSDANASFTAALHEGKGLLFYNTSSVGYNRIVKVLSPTQVLLWDATVPSNTGIEWSFQSEEPSDGEIYTTSGKWYLKTGSGMFRAIFEGRYVRIRNAVNPGNNGYHRINTVIAMHTVELGTSLTAESNLCWRLEGAPDQMDLVERPLEIRVY